MDVEKKEKKKKKIHSSLKEKGSAKGWDRTEVGIGGRRREEGGRKEGDVQQVVWMWMCVHGERTIVEAKQTHAHKRCQEKGARRDKAQAAGKHCQAPLNPLLP